MSFQGQRWILAQSNALLEEAIVSFGVLLLRFLLLGIFAKLVIKTCTGEDMSHW